LDFKQSAPGYFETVLHANGTFILLPPSKFIKISVEWHAFYLALILAQLLKQQFLIDLERYFGFGFTANPSSAPCAF